MSKDRIDDTIFSIILQIHKNNNRPDVDRIHKQILKTADFENVTKDFLDNKTHDLITDEKISGKVKGYLAQF